MRLVRLLFSLCLFGLFLLQTLPAYAQADQPESAPAASPAPPAPAAPETPAPVAPVKMDTVLLRRTPALDGAIEPGEWDAFFQAQQADYSATAFANWDESGVYIAVQADKPTDLMVTLDARNDGWFHGADNYLIKATTGQDGAVAVTLDRYDSHDKMQTPGATRSLDPVEIVCKSTTKADSAVVEMALPAAALEGLKIAQNANIGLRVNVRPAVEGGTWTPMSPLGDVEPCSLSDQKTAAMDQLGVSMVLQDRRVVPGQKLQARLYIKNKSAQTMPLDCYVVGGDGRAAKYMDSQRVRLESLTAGQQIRHKYQSKIPSDMPSGSWALGAEVRAADGKRAGAALTSFEVVKPFEVSMDVGDDPMFLDTEKGRLISVNIKNRTPDRVLGGVTISVPEGWRLKPNLVTRRFQINAEDQSANVSFRMIPRADVKPGEMTIQALVKVNGEEFSLGKKLTLAQAER
ncbi:MAG: hypothetical protein Q7T82_03050 [Armatimonadota bacterium]|nr:hypothetical protein [Armatimonadota bacterium]